MVRVVVGAHDHTAAPLPDAFGVSCRIVEPTECAEHALVCDCPYANGRCAGLRTRIAGSWTAADVLERAFSVDHFLRCVERFGEWNPDIRLRSHVWWPFGATAESEDVHWLLRTMVFVAIWRD